MIKTALRLIVLPTALPFAVGWAEDHVGRILQGGIPLPPDCLGDARALGVVRPDRIRILVVDAIPQPGLAPLRWAASVAGLALSNAAGLSLGYGLYIRKDCFPDRDLIAHECVHTAQCERLGGLRPFLRRYLDECLEFGYLNAPLEREAVQKSCLLFARRRPTGTFPPPSGAGVWPPRRPRTAG